MDMGNKVNREDNGTADERADRGGDEEDNEDMVVEDRGLGRRVGIPPRGGVGMDEIKRHVPLINLQFFYQELFMSYSLVMVVNLRL